MYKWKTNEFGEVVKAKARLVAKGFSQREGIDYFETFSPTPSASSIRLLAAIACELDLDLYHFDAEQAFVQSKLDCDVFIRLPQGCRDMSGKVVRLNRSLYGLKQASRQWYHHLGQCLERLGFEQCLADPCVLRLMENGIVSLLVVVHVDDLLVAGEKSRVDQLQSDLNKMVPINHLGELSWYLGCSFVRNRSRGLLSISQQAYIDKVIDRFGIEDSTMIPACTTVKLEEFDESEPEGDWPFREAVGSLMWIANQTRPDIANAVRAVARHSHEPKSVHWKAVRMIMGYLRTTRHLGITFQRGRGLNLEVYADSDYASKATDRRSVSGGVVMCGGSAVSWFSRTQKCVTLSTSEAEYVAMGDSVKEALFIRSVWSFMLPDRAKPCLRIYEDNAGAIQLAENPLSSSNSKHIDVRHHFLRELVFSGSISIVHVPSKYQHADVLTKPLSRESFDFHRNFLLNLQ